MNPRVSAGLGIAGIAGIVLIACAFAGVFRSKDDSVSTDLPVQASASQPSAPSGTERVLTDRRIQELERRLGELEGRTSSSAPTDNTATAPAIPSMTVEEQKARAQSEHRRAIEDHAREPLDGPWASNTSGTIGPSLRSITANTLASIVNLDCRSKTCVAEIEWRDFQAASSGWKSVLEGDYGRCGVRVLLDEASDPGQPFRTNVLFSCPHVDRSGPPS